MKLVISGSPRVAALVLLGSVSAGAQSGEQLDADAAGKFISLALAGLAREYPNKPGHVFKSDEDVRPPRSLHPVFHGHFDWHSSVHGHWTLVRLLKSFPDHPRAAELRDVLETRFTASGLQAEADYLRAEKSFERMYGWAWALRLGLELRTWSDPQAQRWAQHFAPVEAAIVTNASEHLPKLAWPIRCGFHPETAFPLAQMLDYARGTGNDAFASLLRERSLAYYGKDTAYPVAYEPSGHDFFSPGLNEADLMRRVLSADEFSAWLSRFFPTLASGALGNLLTPVAPADLTDGHLVHLVGLNLNRAWTMRSIAAHLPAGDDPRRAILADAAQRHAKAGLAQVFSGSYEGEHWLGSFAIYLLSDAGR